MEKKVIDENEVKSLSLELQSEIFKLKNYLAKFETNIGLLQAGNRGKPFWNGSNAYATISACIGHFYHDRTLLSNLGKCSDYLNSKIK